MFYPQKGYKRWPVFRTEEEELAVCEECHEKMEGAIKRLREMVAKTPLPIVEQHQLLYQLSHIQQHLRESFHMLMAEKSLRNN